MRPVELGSWKSHCGKAISRPKIIPPPLQRLYFVGAASVINIQRHGVEWYLAANGFEIRSAGAPFPSIDSMSRSYRIKNSF